MQPSIPTALLIPISLLICAHLHAQTGGTATADTARTARVEVSVVDAKQQPRKGEQVLFVSQATKKVFSAYTDAAGKLTITVPAGDDYSVTVKAFTDTTKYGVLKVPPLAPGQHFKDALGVDIMFEPGRQFTLNDVKYDFGKATLRPESLPQLQDLFDYLKWKTDLKVEIAGYTDNVGKDANNIVLSQNRAESVKAWLVKKGIDPARIVAKGYGASQPVADNTTDDGRQKNRRTEVHIL